MWLSQKFWLERGRLDIGINYVRNGDKSVARVPAARLSCNPGRERRQMLDSKRTAGKEDGVRYYHISLF